MVDAANGNLKLHAVFNTDGIRDQLVWGEALECLLGESPFDGDLNLWLGTDGGPQVIEFAGTLASEAFDFELGLQPVEVENADGETEQVTLFLDRREISGGSFLVGFSEQTLGQLGGGTGDGYGFDIVDANTNWTCQVATDFSSGGCQDANGEALSW